MCEVGRWEIEKQRKEIAERFVDDEEVIKELLAVGKKGFDYDENKKLQEASRDSKQLIHMSKFFKLVWNKFEQEWTRNQWHHAMQHFSKQHSEKLGVKNMHHEKWGETMGNRMYNAYIHLKRMSRKYTQVPTGLEYFSSPPLHEAAKTKKQKDAKKEKKKDKKHKGKNEHKEKEAKHEKKEKKASNKRKRSEMTEDDAEDEADKLVADIEKTLEEDQKDETVLSQGTVSKEDTSSESQEEDEEGQEEQEEEEQ